MVLFERDMLNYRIVYLKPFLIKIRFYNMKIKSVTHKFSKTIDKYDDNILKKNL